MVLDIGTYGHVAIVQAVNGDGTIELWDSNVSLDLKVRKRRVPNPPSGLLGYLYAADSDAPPILQNSLIQADGATVYYTQNGRKYHVAGYGVVQAMAGMPGWDWPARSVSQAELDQYRTGPEFIFPDSQSNGLLVQEQGGFDVYLLQNGKKRRFQDPGALNWMGRDWFPDVIQVPAGMLSNPSYVVGTGSPIYELASSLRNAYNTNAGDPNCTASATWKGWPVHPTSSPTFSKCLEFPIQGVGTAPSSAVSGISGSYQNMGAESGPPKGAIEQTPIGTFAVHGEIFTKWRTLSPAYSASFLGFPTGNEGPWNGYRRSNFEGGYVYWNPTTGIATAVQNSSPTCASFSLSQFSANPSSSSGQTTVTLTGSPSGCTGGTWSSTGNGWITVSPSASTGPQTVVVSWAQNTGAQRSASATIANNSFSVTQAAATCTSFSIWPTSANPSSASGQTNVTLTGSPSGCTGGTWSSTGNGWITVSPSSSTGPQTVVVSWAQNTGAQRSASTTIANNSFSVTQSGASAPTCSYFWLSEIEANPSASSGQATVALLGYPGGCTGGSWTATGWDWITVLPTSGVGPRNVTVSWTQNPGAQRSASASIANETFVVTQAAAICTSFSIWPTSANPSSSSGQTTVTLTGSPAGCTGGSWSATGNGWIGVLPPNGVGPQAVTVSWTQNTGEQRSGTASIANKTFTVSQNAASAPTCTSFSIAPTAASPPASSGQTTVTLTGSPAGCGGGSWSASGNGSWIGVVPTSGTGPQSVTVSWTQNTGGQRSGSATIANNSFSVTQATAGGGTVQLSNAVPYADSLTEPAWQQGWRYYSIEVPAGAESLDVVLDQMSADVDLYVGPGSLPTLNSFFCAPYVGGLTAETCSLPSPAAGTWWIGINNWDTGTISYRVTATYAIPSCPHFICEDFEAPLSGWTLSGATQQAAGRIELTPADTWRWGTLARDQATTIDRFTARFQLEVSRPDTGFGADGMTFAVVEGGPSLAGNAGNSMGYGGLSGRSFAIEFDTYANWELGEAGTHVGLDVNGAVLSAASSPINPIRNQGPIDVRIVFDRGWVRVFLQGGATYPTETLVLSATIPNWQPFAGRFAFTAGTGGYGEVHAIDDLTVDLTVDAPSSPGDFNGDGTPDLLFQNQVTAQLVVWYMDGVTRTSGVAVPRAPGTPLWKAIAAADFNGDGKPDILFQNQASAQLVVWYMNGVTWTAGAVVSRVPASPAWQAVGVADFNNDAKPDILFQDQASAQLVVWYMDGVTRTGGAAVSLIPGSPSWKAMAIADFNGDGKADLLFQNQVTAQLVVWYLDGVTRTAGAALVPGQIANPSWKVAGAADFNGDGKPDLVIQHRTGGDLVVWYLDGVTRTSGTAMYPARVLDTNWLVVAP